MSALTLTSVSERLAALAQRAAACSGREAALRSQLEDASTRVAAAKGRAALHDEVQRVFEALQLKAHERSVGAFERLLTRLLGDVLPSEGNVRLSLGLRNNAPALDLYQEKGGALEDIYEANGGAVTNVISAGLRYIALSRTDNRKLMVLDEADCWVKPDRVPAFVKVLAEVAQATATQTFLISHHDIALFGDIVNVVELHTRCDGVRAATVRHAVHQWADDATPGIRAIELHNFRMHKGLVVPCPPGLTAFIGENNYGKSTAISSALRAVAYNQSDDSLISHGESEARVVIHLENRQRLEWSRKPSRNPVVQYALYEGDAQAPVASGKPASRGEAPQWVQDLLGVKKVDDLDIQLRQQKKPVFLLDEPASRRAEILSVGRESGHLKKMMGEYEAVRGEDRLTIKQGEAAATRLTAALGAVSHLSALCQQLHDFQEHFKRESAAVARVDALGTTLTRLSRLQRRATVLGGVLSISQIEELPTWSELESLQRLSSQISRLSKIQGVLARLPAAPRALPDDVADFRLANTVRSLVKYEARLHKLANVPRISGVPDLPDTTGLLRLGQALARCRSKLKALEKVPTSPLPLPDVAADTALMELVNKLENVSSRSKELQSQWEQAASVVAALKKEEAALVEEAGGLCPICGSHLEHQHG